MRKLIEKLVSRLPLDFRVLYRQFLLRVIDLEALSIQADVPRFLGQFAGVLLMISLLWFSAGLIYPILFMDQLHTARFLRDITLQSQQSVISMTFLVIGLIVVLSWDATFPDRRDVMIISPLPVKPFTILVAKVAASTAILALAALALNLPSSLVYSSLLGSVDTPVLGPLRFFCAYWFAIAAGGMFLYGSVLTLQGITTLFFPRRIALRISALLQLATFALLISVYFLEPATPNFSAFTQPQNQVFVLFSPPYWFLAMMNQINGTLPQSLSWLAARAWIGLGVSTAGAVVFLLLSYLRTMKRTVEEPDLVPGAGGPHWTPRIGSSLQTALVLFAIRSLTRSRQHRVALAFFVSVVFCIALSMLHSEQQARLPIPVSMDYLMPTFMMMGFAAYGLRSVFSLPISLTANWVLRTTQLRTPDKYFAATRITMVLFAVAPVWLISAALAAPLTPLSAVAAHLLVLALFGLVLVELSLIGLYKVPFTCSYLPGKVNIQLVFCGILVVYMTLVLSLAEYENQALAVPSQFAALVAALVAVIAGLWAFNQNRSKSAELYFEELPEEPITTLNLIFAPPPRSE